MMRPMRALDVVLTRRARVRLGATATVYCETDGTRTLEREGHQPLRLGTSDREARAALALLHQAAPRPPRKARP